MTNGNDPINGYKTAPDITWDPSGRFGTYETKAPSSLTKREYFAAMAMQGMLAGQDIDNDTEWNKSALADDAVEFANALIDALNADEYVEKMRDQVDIAQERL